MSVSGEAISVDFTVQRQRRVVRSISGAELNGLVDSVEQLVPLQVALHQTYCGATSPEAMVDMLEDGRLHQ